MDKLVICDKCGQNKKESAAVEWLKESIYNHNWDPEEITKTEVINLINKAFKDCKKENNSHNTD